MTFVRTAALAATAMTVLLAAAAADSASAQADIVVHLKPLPSGAMKKMGGYRPQRVELSAEKPAALHEAPADLSAPLYGVFPVGAAAKGETSPRGYLLIVDEPADKDARLFVDTNANGDLTDDAPAEWTVKPSDEEGKQLKQYNGIATINLGSADHPFPAQLGVYRFDKNDPQRAALKNVLLYYPDYAYEGDVMLGGKTINAMLVDQAGTGDFRGKEGEEGSGIALYLDVNANGAFDRRGEIYDIRKPFNIGGTTYEIAAMSASGAEFKIVKSSQTVAEIPTPPDHRVGKKITPFEAQMMDSKTVDFPADFKGKIVMLDFWATWCGPCMREVPGLVKAYETHHAKGFEVLGISLDKAEATDKIKEVTGKNKMTWSQVYDGKFWDAAIAKMYVIQSIPTAYLVDGDSGEIIATGSAVRGEELDKTIKDALEKKFGPKSLN